MSPLNRVRIGVILCAATLGLAWGRAGVDADVTPNLQAVAPGAYQLPPVSGPVGDLPKDQKAKLEQMLFP